MKRFKNAYKKKKTKCWLITTLIVVVSLLVAFPYVRSYYTRSELAFLFPEVPTPKIEIPVVYNIGWWAYQDSVKIDSLTVEIVHSKLNLFSSKSLISYTVSGKINHGSIWFPHIEKVHVSEYMNRDTSQLYDRTIEIMPVVVVKKTNKEEGVESFLFKNEHLIQSTHWGRNVIRIICGDKEQIILLQQRK